MAGPAALLSVSDRTGLVTLGASLRSRGFALFGTSGTAAALRDAGLPCEEVGALTGFPPLCDGRVKTLHPKVFAGILADRDRPQHLADLDKYEIPTFDLVVVNLYPFEQTVAKAGASEADVVEQIDIGGVTLLRAAAKNHAHVAVLVDPAQYAEYVAALERGGPTASERRNWAAAAFARCERYDAAIAAYFACLTMAGLLCVQGNSAKSTCRVRLACAMAKIRSRAPHSTSRPGAFRNPRSSGVKRSRTTTFWTWMRVCAYWRRSTSRRAFRRYPALAA